jgi:general secretion pathway protein A
VATQMATASRGELTVDSLRRLGFREYPFSLSADPRFLYLSKQHLAVLDRVEDVIALRDGLAVVEGEIGVGKTTIARRLHEMHAMEPDFNIVYIHTAAYSSPGEATRDISVAFGQTVRRAHIDQLRNFEKFLVHEREENRNVVVIIDDAQKINASSLDAFQNFLNFDVKVKLIQIILFGQPEIHSAFGKNEAVNSRVASWQKLSPLPPDDALSMIQFRSQLAGRQEPLLTDSGFLRLYEYTSGVPRPIIIICGEILRILSRKGIPIADDAEVQVAIQAYRERHTGSKEE